MKKYIDQEKIKKILPQRFPYLMIDRILEFQRKKSIVAIKNVTANEIFFLGHFPDISIMPGTMIVEAMAQTAIIFLQDFLRITGKPYYYLTGVKMHFLHPVIPGDVLKIKVTPEKIITNSGILNCEGVVDSKVVARGQLTLVVKENKILKVR